eukprot:TRINITY_DN2050_c0_g1_i2.p1 TRINITY_DN2050_c0_g1~~TRINITY_DN2050_c0_g1_i2.p1  ORF type:complete len:222 (+),score=34.28 TRINITY_DN2050_c0_g1_i2:135-800(+)
MSRAIFFIVLLASVLSVKAQSTVYPVLVCSDYNPTSQTLTALVKAINNGTTDIVQDIGPGNFFTPGMQDQGQPNYFPVGESSSFAVAFRVFDPSDSIAWKLLGRTLEITNSSGPSCGASSCTDCKDFPTDCKLVEKRVGRDIPDAQLCGGDSFANSFNCPQKVLTVTCPAGSIMLQGGGYCGDITVLSGSYAVSNTTWGVSCVGLGRRAYVSALCCSPKSQ